MSERLLRREMDEPWVLLVHGVQVKARRVTRYELLVASEEDDIRPFPVDEAWRKAALKSGWVP